MIKKTLYLHIGHTKTGSSSLQKYFDTRFDEYLTEGLLYPKTGRLKPNGIAQHKFVFFVNDKYPGWLPENQRNITSKIFQVLNKEVKQYDCDKILLSAESFTSITDLDRLKSLKKYFKNFEIKIIAYLRHPDKWLESWYAQVVKDHPFTNATFSQFIKRHKVDIYSTLDKYAQVFGEENLMIYNYESVQNSHQSIIKHFCEILNISFVDETNFSNTNITPGVELIEVLRKVNEIVELPVEKHRKLNLMLVKELASKINNQKGYLTDEERRKLKMHYWNELKEKEYSLFKERETEFIGEIK